jgi:hypothetical protein
LTVSIEQAIQEQPALTVGQRLEDQLHDPTICERRVDHKLSRDLGRFM